MDDGYKSTNGFYICTESFSFEEQLLIVKILKNKFNLESNPHKVTNGYRIYIPSSSKNKLIELTKPFIIPHFLYKFNL